VIGIGRQAGPAVDDVSRRPADFDRIGLIAVAEAGNPRSPELGMVSTEPKPSTRLSDSGEALPSIATCRDVNPAQITRLVRGEHDWITMRALEKDSRRRYPTALELGRIV
jgi:hypothetical protein